MANYEIPQGQRGRRLTGTEESDPLSALLRERKARGEALIQPGGKPLPGAGDDLIRLLDQRKNDAATAQDQARKDGIAVLSRSRGKK